MTGRILFAAYIAVTALLLGCSSDMYKRPDEITGNNTGGVIPAALAKKSDVQTLATTHCAKWGSIARITFPASQTGGEVVFVCEKPGQAQAMNPEMPPQPEIKSTTKTKRKN